MAWLPDAVGIPASRVDEDADLRQTLDVVEQSVEFEESADTGPADFQQTRCLQV